ncbi:MAG: DNA-protecting protein DprA [Solirubrobacteraceae bacterium]|nr:DNA-protecting protein DprA [Solirubrobacteraceae bacterium]
MAEVSPEIDRRFRGRRVPGILAMDDERLAATLGRHGRARPDALDLGDEELLQRARALRAAHRTDAICRHDPEFPARLSTIDDPPALLYVRDDAGRLVDALAGRPSVAIVGSRQASDEAREMARRLGADLASAGVVVVSGMAFGVDAAAHDGALTVHGGSGRGSATDAADGVDGAPSGPGRTVAILGGGPERSSPARLSRLYERIVRHGVVASELPPGTTPRPWTFPARNRLLAGLVDLVVVVAARPGSGSLITAGLVLSDAAGDRLAVVPGSTTDPRCAGSNALLREPGVTAVLDASDVLARLPARPGGDPGTFRPSTTRDPLAGLDGDGLRLARCLLDGPRTLESIVDDLDAVRVLAGLAELEAAGRLRRSVDGALVLDVA